MTILLTLAKPRRPMSTMSDIDNTLTNENREQLAAIEIMWQRTTTVRLRSNNTTRTATLA